MTRICFVSYEIHPSTPGGCGVLLHHSARLLLEQGHEVVFLLDVNDRQFEQFNQRDRLKLPNAENCRAYQVAEFLRQAPAPHNMFKTWFEYRSYTFYCAARQVYRLEKPDIIEFFDYCGAAYHALSAKVAGLDFQESHLAIRLHNSLELIDREQPDNLHGLDRYIMYGLEHQSLRFAESVLYPSRAYLGETYQKHYEPWFGNLVHSQPALLEHPKRQGGALEADGILFFGRLFGFKGIDRFVDAAVLYLSRGNNPPRYFYFVGYDSLHPPTDHSRYQDYLLSKVPDEFRERFKFMGQISWQELGALLPRVLFTVIPSYLESYCYAAHELYEAGVPLILADIPAFRDSFQHGENALVFDGTVSDLADKMSSLSLDDQLRAKITRPYSINREPLGDFYNHTPTQSWIQVSSPEQDLRLLVCILVDEPAWLGETLESIKAAQIEDVQIVIMVPVERKSRGLPDDHAASLWFLGQMCIPQNLAGEPVSPTDLKTSDALIILKSGDTVDRNFLTRALGILRRQDQIAYVGCWQQHEKNNNKTRLDTLSYDCVVEALPYLHQGALHRFVMRTPPGQLVIDLFDGRAGPLGELAYLWELENSESCGIIIPETGLTSHEEQVNLLSQPYLDYLQIRDNNPVRKQKLARLHLSLHRRERVLRDFYVVNRQTSTLQSWTILTIHTLATSRLSKWADNHPVIKNCARAIVSKAVSIMNRFPKKKTL